MNLERRETMAKFNPNDFEYAHTPIGKYFLNHIHIEKGGCWRWKGKQGRLRNSPGTVRVWGERHSLLRVAYAVAFGNPPSDRYAGRTCGNWSCCNPFHLKLKKPEGETEVNIPPIQLEEPEDYFDERRVPQVGRVTSPTYVRVIRRGTEKLGLTVQQLSLLLDQPESKIKKVLEDMHAKKEEGSPTE
jgi:hypothetical protein